MSEPDWTARILSEIARPTARRVDVARLCARATLSTETIDWMVVEAAMVQRWNARSIRWVKNRACRAVVHGEPLE